MERQRGLYLNIFGIALLLVIGNALSHRALQNMVYRVLARPVSFVEAKLRSKKIAALEQERNDLAGKLVAAEALERENDALRRQLHVDTKAPGTLVAAKIFSLQRTLLVSTLMIDRGSADGAAPRMVVAAPGNVLVGTIGEVFQHASRVIIADDPRLIISARIMGTSILAESKGGFQNNVVISLVAHTEALETGSMVVTSGLDGIPAGLAIGTITHVDRGSSALFKDVRAALLFDAAQSPLVFVLKP